MTANEVLNELKSLADAQTKKTLLRHGAVEPIFGVKVEHLKKIQKRVKHDHALALELFDSGVSDAMYLAALISEPAKMTKTDLNRWAKQATWHMISEFSVAWTAAESPHALELALKWIDAKAENVVTAGWATLSSYVGITPDEELDLSLLKKLLDRVVSTLAKAPDRVRYTMNGFLISIGCYVAPLTAEAKAAAATIGKVTVNMGDTACKVPDAVDYINKVIARGSQGKKRKTAFC